MIISSASAYSLVENKYFQQIVKMYTSETLQDRTALRILQNDYYEAKIKEIRNKFLKMHTLAAITDSWTAKILRKSFIHLCIIFLDEKWLPDCIDLGVYNMIGSHTAQNLAEKLMQIFQNFGITDKVTTLVADNAANMKLLGEALELHYCGCLAHMLNLIVKRAFVCFGKVKAETKNEGEIYFSSEEEEEDSENEEGASENPYSKQKEDLLVLKKLFKDIRKIICLFNSSTLLLDELMASQTDPKLVPSIMKN